MSSKLQEMSTVKKIESGVEVRVQGEVEKQAIEEMVASCATGTHACCGADFFAKVEGIDVGGTDGDVSIQVHGSGVSEELMRNNLATCDCYRG